MAKGLAKKKQYCQIQMQKNRLAYKDFDKDFTKLLSYLQFILKTVFHIVTLCYYNNSGKMSLTSGCSLIRMYCWIAETI